MRAFRHGDESSDAFDQVRAAIPLYRGLPPEPGTPGLECLLALDEGRPVGRLSLREARGLQGLEEPAGLVGHFEAADAISAHALLLEARATLAARGVRHVVGPMNGSTWGRYRLALPPAGTAGAPDVPFLGEPVNPDEYSAWFESAGFTVAARYESRIDDSPGTPAPDAHELSERVARAGITVRPLDPNRFEEELRVLFALSLAAFADNPYYTPIGWDDFRAPYVKLHGIIDPGLVLIAEDDSGRPLAFQFAYMDPLASAAGAPARAVIKTVATLAEARGRGLAGHMVDLLRARAVELGARSVVHALMHTANFSMNMSSRHDSRVHRRYALYEWRP